MSKIKLKDKDIKLRGREPLTVKVVRRINIKALSKKAKPTAQEDRTIEADAIDTGENMAVSSVRRVTAIREQVASKQKNLRKNPVLQRNRRSHLWLLQTHPRMILLQFE